MNEALYVRDWVAYKRTNTETNLNSHTDTHSPGVGRSHSGSILIPGSELETHVSTRPQLNQLLMRMRAATIRNNTFRILHDRSNYRTRRPLLLEMAQKYVVHTSWGVCIYVQLFPASSGKACKNLLEKLSQNVVLYCLDTLLTNAL